MIEVEIGPNGDFTYLLERDEIDIVTSDPRTGASAEAVLARIQRVLDHSSEA